MADAGLTGKDIGHFKGAIEAIERKNWKRLTSHIHRIKDPLALKTLKWFNLLRPLYNPSPSPFYEFIAENPEWPHLSKMQQLAESVIPTSTPAAQALTIFEQYPPQTTDGKVIQAAALLTTDQRPLAIKTIRQLWIDRNFSKVREQQFYKKYRTHLTSKDHLQRMDRLLWEGQYWPVRRHLWRVPKEYRKLAEARISLRVRRGNVDKLVSQVPKQYANDAGLLYERLRWRRKKNKESVFELVSKIPDDPPYPEKWWDERASLARTALNKGHITEAYKIASRHGLPKGADYAEAEWLAGWISHSFLNDYDVSIKHFTNMYNSVRYPVSLARGSYWVGRSIESKGDVENAKKWYSKASNFINTYYGQLAILKLDPNGNMTLVDEPAYTESEYKQFQSHELVKAVRMLSKYGGKELIKPFILKLRTLSETVGWQVLCAKLSRETGRVDLSVTVAKLAMRSSLFMPISGYPLIKLPTFPKHAKQSQPEPSLVHALIRQESLFRINAISRAKARGLMQLMPRTASNVAKGLKIPYRPKKLLTDGAYNTTLGQAYLADMINKYDGSYVLSLAAYNAGPHRANQWIKLNGDPRDADVDTVDWIETIPYNETRNYVQRVMENLQIYRMRLSNTEIALSLDQDLNQ